MINQAHISGNDKSFRDFLSDNVIHKRLYWFIAAAVISQYAVFKYLYPYASYIHGDSFLYIKGAAENLNINTYLIGYSKFLRIFSVFSNSDIVLTLFQYLLIQVSGLALLFSMFYFYRPNKTVQIILLCFFVFNPLFLHLANLVSSDGVFLAVSIIWFTLLLWIIHKPSTLIIVWHATVIFVAITLRYNAMIYPFISIGAFFLSNMSLRRKIVGVSPGIVLCLLFVLYTSYEYKKLTGYWQYSPFSGWQMANNAMYAYRYVDSAKRKPVAKEFIVVDKMVRAFFDSTRDVKKYPSEAAMASTFYMWSPSTPLYTYRNGLFSDTSVTEFKKWASMGPYYKSYGIHLIKKYPLHFVRYFIWPNANKYYSPPVEYLGVYNSGMGFVTHWAKNWFRYKSYEVGTRMNNNYVWVLDFYPILSGIINVVMLCVVFCFLFLKGWQYNVNFGKGMLLGGCLWALNAVFTIFASSAALRFQSFPIIMTFTLSVFLVSWMVELLSMYKEKTMENKAVKEDLETGIAV